MKLIVLTRTRRVTANSALNVKSMFSNSAKNNSWPSTPFQFPHPWDLGLSDSFVPLFKTYLRKKGFLEVPESTQSVMLESKHCPEKRMPDMLASLCTIWEEIILKQINLINYDLWFHPKQLIL
jgi:hypothetical protein